MNIKRILKISLKFLYPQGKRILICNSFIFIVFLFLRKIKNSSRYDFTSIFNLDAFALPGRAVHSTKNQKQVISI